MKILLIIYADLESSVEKISICHNNNKNHQQPK